MREKQTEPSATTLKARRRRTPHFDDEPIQWHRNSSEHDKCPWCGLAEVCYFTKTKRSCDNCGVSFDLFPHFPSGKKWFEAKLNGYRSHYDGAPDLEIVEPPWRFGGHYLTTAQRASHKRRALLVLKFGYDTLHVFWHEDGHVPEREDGKRICNPGSNFWYWLLKRKHHKIWAPDDPLNEMEIIARGATDDPVFAIMER